MPVDLDDRQNKSEVTSCLRDLFLPGDAFVAPLLELRNDDAQQLNDDRCRDVRHDAETEHCEVGQRAAGEDLQQRQDAAGRVVGCVG